VQARLDAMLEAVKTERPAMDKFYSSLTDEQKARFNALRPPQQPIRHDGRLGSQFTPEGTFTTVASGVPPRTSR
jgi:hypothetical protein